MKLIYYFFRFFEELGNGSADDVSDDSGIDDADAEAAANREVKLYKVHGEGDDIATDEVSGKPLKQGMLNQEVTILTLHHRDTCYFQYIGLPYIG